MLFYTHSFTIAWTKNPFHVTRFKGSLPSIQRALCQLWTNRNFSTANIFRWEKNPKINIAKILQSTETLITSKMSMEFSLEQSLHLTTQLASPRPPLRGCDSVRVMYCQWSGLSPQFPHLSLRYPRKSSPSGVRAVELSIWALIWRPIFTIFKP